MKSRTLRLTLLCAALLPVAAFTMGGWAVVTVDDLPDYLVAGKPNDLAFVVRQHGVTMLRDLQPTVTLTSGSTTATARAREINSGGHYLASITPPRAGQWTMRIQSGFGNSANTLLPIEAIPANTQRPHSFLATADRGHQLFFAKGCVSCHVRGEDGLSGMKYAPNLTGRSFPAEPLSKFLADPTANRLSATASQDRMPNLQLKADEISALVMFLNSDAKQLGVRR